MTTIDTRGDAVAQLHTAADNYLTTWRADIDGPLPEASRSSIGTATAAIGRTTAIAREAIRQAQRTDEDDTLFPEGRDRLVRETLDAARAAVADDIATADAATTVAGAELYEAAKVPLDRRDATTARQDALMMLGNAQSTGKEFEVLRRLAVRQDAIGALVSTGWLRDYLTAQGREEDTIAAAEVLVRDGVLRAATAQTADPQRRAAAQTALALPNLIKARITAQHSARLTLDSYTTKQQRRSEAIIKSLSV
ncbi:hypothetical protein ACFWZ2_22960 [Streptomyces sp. NPDC059002]|uniref:hypothetical protein n=1 Tax=Streptomyces sp. NPDC059002 TaxID=3346690 RepID=UPI00367F2D28